MSTAPTFTSYNVPANQVFFTSSTPVPDAGNTGDTYTGGYPSDSPTGWEGTGDPPNIFNSFTFDTESDGTVQVTVNYTDATTGATGSEVYGHLTPTGDQNSSTIAFTGADGDGSTGSFPTGTWIVMSNTELTPTQDGSGFTADLPNNGAQFDTSVSCYAAGTMILTAEGEVPVENLKVGDLAITSSGEARAIRWIGHRRFQCRFYPPQNEVCPVRIEAGTFGPNLPNRDLLLSPGHGVAVTVVDEVLIPVGCLINGATIRQVRPDEVTYYHVELDTPDVIVANGLPAESYIDVGNRASFISADAKVANLSFSEAAPAHIEWARPKVYHGTVLQAVKERLNTRAMAAGWTLGSTFEGFHALVDGEVLQPQIHEGKARFLIPVGAKDVRLCSTTSAPLAIEGTADNRMLGVALSGIAIDDMLTGRREIAMDDPRLASGFHGVEQYGAGQTFRWTDGEARLPASLWEGCVGLFFLQVGLLSGRPCWVAPAVEQQASQAPLQLVSGL